MTTRNPIQVVVAQRRSIVPGTDVSRSVTVRLAEPCEYMSKSRMITMQALPTERIDADVLRNVDLVAISRSFAEETTRLLTLARACGVPCIYDVDDWMLDFPAYAPLQVTPGMRAMIQEHMRLADVITVPSDTLAARMERVTSTRIAIVPTAFYGEKYVSKMAPPAGKDVAIVFSNMMALKLGSARDAVLTALADALQRHPQATLHYFGDAFEQLDRFPRLHNWGILSYEDHKRALARTRFDLSINPVAGWEDPESFHFNRCKSPIKYLEYGWFGIPGLFSRTPIYEEVVEHEVTGLLVENTYESWSEAIKRMLVDRSLRLRLGENARYDVRARHSMESVAQEWCRLFEAVVSASGRSTGPTAASESNPSVAVGNPLLPATTPIRVVLVRHAETAANTAGAIGCSDEEPLSYRGRAQALSLGRKLREWGVGPWTRAFASAALRARQTALPLCADVPLELVDEIKEVNTGAMTPLSWSLFQQEHRDLYDAFTPETRFPGGESYAGAQRRALAWLDSLLSGASGGETLLVVTHGGIIGLILHHLLSVPLSTFPAFRIDNASATVIDLYRSPSGGLRAHALFIGRTP